MGLAKLHGTSTTYNKMIKTLLKFFCPYKSTSNDRTEFYEGWTADQYTCPELKSRIIKRYKELYNKKETPVTHPEKYDPLNPPSGWKWDPCYECWIQLNE